MIRSCAPKDLPPFHPIYSMSLVARPSGRHDMSNSALLGDITAFRHYLEAERGMARNTVLAYDRDMQRFGRWAVDGGLSDYLAPKVRELTDYLGFLRDEGLAPPSVARHLVALKIFYRFLRLEERVAPG